MKSPETRTRDLGGQLGTRAFTEKLCAEIEQDPPKALQFCANLNFLFPDLPLLERFEAAAQAGFKGVELLSPYELPSQASASLDATGLKQVLFNTPAGDRAGGERGMACIPGREAEFRGKRAPSTRLRGSARLQADPPHGGHPPEGVPYDTAAALYAAHLAWAASRRERPVCACHRAINHHDVPGYFLRTQEQAAAIIGAIAVDRVGLQFDLYHCQTAQGDVTRRLEALMPPIVHMQVADVPGRNEPGTGEIGWEFLFDRIQALGYPGWIGCEYEPKGNTVAGLSWRHRYGV